MKIKQTLPNLHLICSNDNLREHLQYAVFDFTNRAITATNAHVALIVDMNQYLDEIEDIGILYVHKNDYKQMCKKDVEYIRLDANNSAFICEGKTKTLAGYKKQLDNTYPDVSKVIPEVDTKASEDVKMALNVGILTSLVDVFGKYDTIVFTPTMKHKEIRVDIQSVGGYYDSVPPKKLAYGVIMPVAI